MAAQDQTYKSKGPAPTVDQINADRVTQLANLYWAPHTAQDHAPFDKSVVDGIYLGEICGSKFSIRRTMMLEFSQYMENYLWPNYKTGEATHAHMMSIVVMLNEKFRERVPAWEAFKKHPDHFSGFFQQVLEASLSTTNVKEKTSLIVFLNHSFNSMEVELVREQVKRLVSLSMWISLQEGRREYEFKKCPKWRKFWIKINKRDAPEQKIKLEWERKFLHRLMLQFIEILEEIPEQGDISPETIQYCERFLELMIDLEALLPTRRFFNTVMDDCHLVVRCYLSPLVKKEEGNLFVQVR
uniref:RNA helicase aquarius N-terminal domain-containing protein n=1 Tax=Clastoptera arizonana TaxID=38151 RepID=A0A1B6DEG6_9HEMI